MADQNIDELAEKVAERVVALRGDDRPLYSPATLATRLGISERAARELIREDGGKIPSFKVEGSRRIEPAAVDAYIAQQKNDAA